MTRGIFLLHDIKLLFSLSGVVGGAKIKKTFKRGHCQPPQNL